MIGVLLFEEQGLCSGATEKKIGGWAVEFSPSVVLERSELMGLVRVKKF